MKSLPLQTLTLAAIALLISLLGVETQTALLYQQSAIEQGQWWRLLTGHWVHTNMEHMWLDVLGLVILGGALEKFAPKWISITLLLGVGLVNLALWHLGIETYCGLSGALHALLLPLIWQLWQRYKNPILPIIAAMTLVKMLFEISQQQTVFMTNTWPPIIESHLAGYIAGAIICFIWQVLNKAEITLQGLGVKR